MPPLVLGVLLGVAVVGIVGVGVVYAMHTESCHKQKQRSRGNYSPNKFYRCKRCENVFPFCEIIYSEATNKYLCESCFFSSSCISCGERPTIKYRNCRKNHKQLCEHCLYKFFKNGPCPEEECREIKKRF